MNSEKFLKSCGRALVVAFVAILLQWHSFAQGTLRTITFEGPPELAPDSNIGVRYYYDREGAFTFTPMRPDGMFTRHGGFQEGFPSNGTAYLIFGLGDSLSGSRGGTRFGLHSVDLAEFSTYYPYPRTVQFIGYRPDGSTVMNEFITDGIIDGTGPLPDFQTFYFDAKFADITRFEIPGYRYALDNLVFNHRVPEPATSALFLAGVSLLVASRARRRC